LYNIRINNVCCDIVSSYGYVLQWVDSIRYLGVHFVRGRYFKCNLDNAKASFYRAFNAVYGRIDRSGSEEVILQLIRFKCMPCLLYALEACPVNKTQLRSLEFTLNRVLMKVFQTTSMDVIAECRLSILVWPTGNGDADCQAQSEVYGQVRLV